VSTEGSQFRNAVRRERVARASYPLRYAQFSKCSLVLLRLVRNCSRRGMAETAAAHCEGMLSPDQLLGQLDLAAKWKSRWLRRAPRTPAPAQRWLTFLRRCRRHIRCSLLLLCHWACPAEDPSLNEESQRLMDRATDARSVAVLASAQVPDLRPRFDSFPPSARQRRSATMIYGDVVDGRIGQALEKVSGLVFANSTQAARGDA
jgi:hypothetical protein